ncbi:MAG: phosphatidate cytidylyltransferase [Halieaceae bacterium]
MLKQRIITALVLVAILISAVIYLSLPMLALLIGAVVLIAAWEWSDLAGCASRLARVLYVAAFGVSMLALFIYSGFDGRPELAKIQPVLGVACLWWAIALLWIKGYPQSAVLWGTGPMLGLMGVLVLVPAWLAVIFLLSYEQGTLMFLAMIVLVACADIGAYFTGRQWGRRKLAIEVSPGKSWEGFWGGLVACVGVALLAAWWLDLARLSLPGVAAIAVSGSLASVVGDLLESMVKRHRGVKDSGKLLPGHGGFLDRIDGITAAAPVMALGLILAGWQP